MPRPLRTWLERGTLPMCVHVGVSFKEGGSTWNSCYVHMILLSLPPPLKLGGDYVAVKSLGKGPAKYHLPQQQQLFAPIAGLSWSPEGPVASLGPSAIEGTRSLLRRRWGVCQRIRARSGARGRQPRLPGQRGRELGLCFGEPGAVVESGRL